MLDSILHALNEFREGTSYPVVLPYLRYAVVFIVGLCAGFASAVQVDDVLADVRAALRHAGITDKEVTSYFGGSRGNCADRLCGERALTLQKLATLPVEFWQWWAVSVAARHGIPVPVTTGARLARRAHRQARMSLHPRSQKAGVA